MSQEYYDHLNEGEKYTCDRCNTAELGVWEYDQFIKFQYHYCETCWNYMQLKKGTCDQCGASMTNRSEYAIIFIKCGCGNEVELKWQ
jgi:hypothetical protein|tara:strand:- start:66 stop:326 length:261 start_codon:yes stop_codon:yes gene_type:complete